MNNVDKALAVIGADLDISLVKNLVKGDQVLLEMNGMRAYRYRPSDPNSCPLVSEEAWRVKSNDSKALTLSHRRMPSDLVLPYSALLQYVNCPAVFQIHDKMFSTPGPIYVIVQFVGHWMQESDLTEQFPNRFNEAMCRSAMEDDRVKLGLMEKWSSVFKTFKKNGFSYKSLKRLALQARVSDKALEAIQAGAWVDALAIDDESLVSIHRALSWLPHFMKQASWIAHDPNAEYIAQ